ncbi:hypothetical protein [Ornithinimicrobium tianjinense]|uniref:Uncharacterized protein n=1 Tax=Ornithinimicrobium tianjinense TaxID=1195761 RepID=A0A917BR72_9MICO|nr:hypothetical protein [Ornithinimicrobium tianjinense]GGF53008.1 hypothetical protein GCM10011366_20960 [Ornithinimicrobium tianjinense]
MKPDDDGDEVDPTGVRQLLRSLPDPGPLPEHLALRIEAALRQEQARRSASAVPLRRGPEPLRGADTGVVDLASERARRRPLRTVSLVAGAAAGLLVAAVAVGNLLDSGVVGGADSAAYAPTTGDRQEGGAADSAGAGSVDEGSAGGQMLDPAGASEESSLAHASQAPIDLLPHLGAVTADDFDDRILAGLASDAAMAESGSGLTAAQANSCWETVGSQADWWSRSAAPAAEDGRDVVVLLALDADLSGHTWLVPGECVTDRSARPLADAAVTP